ncbi:MAG: hypothetical protein H6Q49_943 [Deltaproteobacteria bacterium]|nr:hypothetical protein [Deltaproteobacteria bacterium]
MDVHSNRNLRTAAWNARKDEAYLIPCFRYAKFLDKSKRATYRQDKGDVLFNEHRGR